MEYIFKNNIEKLALRNKFSLTKISELSGVSISTLSRIFSGKIKKPNQSTVDQIADFFKVPSHLLLSKDFDLENEFEEEFKHSSIKNRLLYLMKKTSISSIDELSMMSDVPITTIKSILQEECEKPQLETCIKLSEFFNISISQFRCEEDLSYKNNNYVSVPVICFNDFENWNNNLVKKRFIKKYNDYYSNDKNDYFMIEIDSEFKLDVYDIGDILVFLKKNEIQSNGQYLCKIDNKISLYKIIYENNVFYYKPFFSKEKIKLNNIITYGELVEVKINCKKDEQL